MNNHLGQIQTATQTEEQVFKALLETSRELFPQETAKAEDWIREQAIKYGYIYGKDEVRMKMRSLIQNPWVWFAGGIGATLLFKNPLLIIGGGLLLIFMTRR